FGQIDMLLCGLEMMALYLLFTANISPNRSRLMAAYSFMGLGILAKGPVGLIIPLGIYIAVSLTTKKPIARPRSHFVWGPVLALIFPGLWLLAAWWSGAPEGFFHELLFKQNVGRLSGEFGGHVKPFYYFLYYFPLDFLPWTLVLPLSWRALGQDRQTRSGRLALLAWMVFVILFFSLSSSKRNLYILSVYPAAAIMVAAGIDHWSFVSRSMIRATFWSLWVLLLLIGLAMAASVFVHNVPINTVMLLPGGLTMLAGCWWTYDLFQARKEAPGWLAAMSSIVMINFASIGLFVYPEFNAFKIPDEIIHVAHDNLAPTDRIIMYKQHGEIFSLYAERKGIMLYSQTELASFINQASQKNHMILALDRELPDIVSVVGEGHETHRFRMGNKRLVWLLIKRESEL
ncbi:MAG TPA: hypothetical protein PJ991_06310, partial [Kiritimatiellia bacterium]|nr:hypothetical protein [Kiritimatiellia bacterium]